MSKTTIAAGGAIVGATAYLLWPRVSSGSSDVADDFDPDDPLDAGASYGDAGDGFNAGGRVDQIQDNESTDMDGGMVGL
ncbi:hypothetical protein [Halostella sp. PRR32]|uniref:hypothetical protein n=1 Tax=Halostella sp. PRR32 TaxID=3098147 RepID=UPI002B1DE3AE|nr:hypothetical protein [Halostella sp. PRR32]